jgi:CRISPR-associated protein Cmr3
MGQTFIRIRGVDPLLFRDGRPFTAEAGGLTARSLPLPFPTTIAAFIRSQVGAANDWDWSSHDDCRKAHDISVSGPLLLRKEGLEGKWQCVLPAPKDALLSPQDEESATVTPLRPCQDQDMAGGGCDLPDDPVGLLPLTRYGKLPEYLTAEQEDARSTETVIRKPPKDFHFWPKEAVLAWLEGNLPGQIPQITGLPEEERIGIQTDERGKAEEGKLYAARFRAFEERHKDRTRQEYALLVRAKLADGNGFATTGTLGGERRLTTVEMVEDNAEIWPRCPESLKQKLRETKKVRMVLATPAQFTHGWKPGWIGASGSGVEHLPAGIANVELKLVAAAIDRRVPVSGWGLREGKPRPIRWLVPAGSVYFFKVMAGDPSALYEKAWMKPMSDDESARRDGLGLALWGTW